MYGLACSLQGITDSFKDAVDSVSDSVKVRESLILSCAVAMRAKQNTACHCTIVHGLALAPAQVSSVPWSSPLGFLTPQNIFSGLGDKASDAEGTAKDAQGDVRGAVSDAIGSA